jgi:hypothetical protein
LETKEEVDMNTQLDSEKYLDALLEVVYTALSSEGLKSFPSFAEILIFIRLNTSPETFTFLRYNGLTPDYVRDWLRRRSEKEDKG